MLPKCRMWLWKKPSSGQQTNWFLVQAEQCWSWVIRLGRVHTVTQSLRTDTDNSCFKTTSILVHCNLAVTDRANVQSIWRNATMQCYNMYNMLKISSSLEWAVPWLVKLMFKEGADCSESNIMSCSRYRYLILSICSSEVILLCGKWHLSKEV